MIFGDNFEYIQLQWMCNLLVCYKRAVHLPSVVYTVYKNSSSFFFAWASRKSSL